VQAVCICGYIYNLQYIWMLVVWIYRKYTHTNTTKEMDHIFISH
jgi:hypothetical protein